MSESVCVVCRECLCRGEKGVCVRGGGDDELLDSQVQTGGERGDVQCAM